MKRVVHVLLREGKSPDQLTWDDSNLYAEQGSKPGEANPTIYRG